MIMMIMMEEATEEVGLQEIMTMIMTEEDRVMVDGLEILKDMLKLQKEDGKAGAEEEVVPPEMKTMIMIMMIVEVVVPLMKEAVVVRVQDHPAEDGMETHGGMLKPRRKAGKIANN